MTKKILQKILFRTALSLAVLTIVLGIHIYLVTRPSPPNVFTRAMARINIRQPINACDAAVISKWLYQQKGVDHVLVNPQTAIVVFSYYPVQTTATAISNQFISSLPYPAEQFIPSAAQMSSGCPVAPHSPVFKIYQYFKNL